MKYLAAFFCFFLWIVATVAISVTIIGLLILAVFDEVNEQWFKEIPQSILMAFKK